MFALRRETSAFRVEMFAFGGNGTKRTCSNSVCKYQPTVSLASAPAEIIIWAITSGSLIYQFDEAATKLIIKNLVDALCADALILHECIKLVF